MWYFTTWLSGYNAVWSNVERGDLKELFQPVILKAFLVTSEIVLSAFILGSMLSALCPVAWISTGQHIILISRELWWSHLKAFFSFMNVKSSENKVLSLVIKSYAVAIWLILLPTVAGSFPKAGSLPQPRLEAGMFSCWGEAGGNTKSCNLFLEALHATDLHSSILYYINISSEPWIKINVLGDYQIISGAGCNKVDAGVSLSRVCWSLRKSNGVVWMWEQNQISSECLILNRHQW